MPPPGHGPSRGSTGKGGGGGQGNNRRCYSAGVAQGGRRDGAVTVRQGPGGTAGGCRALNGSAFGMKDETDTVRAGGGGGGGCTL